VQVEEGGDLMGDGLRASVRRTSGGAGNRERALVRRTGLWLKGISEETV
jgi:hypothetical protein